MEIKKLKRKMARLEKKFEKTPEECTIKRDRIMKSFLSTEKRFNFLTK